jgi:hypothetical protein
MPQKKSKRKVQVEVTFNLPDNPESIEEVEKLLIEQWQAQLPEIRRKLLEEAKKHEL